MKERQAHIDRARLSELIQSRERGLKDLMPFEFNEMGWIQGVRLINDSAATSVDKVAESLMTFEKPVIWIAEANERSRDMHLLAEVVEEKVSAIVAVGSQSNKLLEKLWGASRMFVSANTWSEALDISLELARDQDEVIFSPGCRASDPFENYKERGAYFNRLVELKRKGSL